MKKLLLLLVLLSGMVAAQSQNPKTTPAKKAQTTKATPAASVKAAAPAASASGKVTMVCHIVGMPVTNRDSLTLYEFQGLTLQPAHLWHRFV